MKRVICILLILCTLFLFSCKKDNDNGLTTNLSDANTDTAAGADALNTSISLHPDSYIQFDPIFDETQNKSVNTLQFSRTHFASEKLGYIYENKINTEGLISDIPKNSSIPPELIDEAQRALFCQDEFIFYNLEYTPASDLSESQILALKMAQKTREIVVSTDSKDKSEKVMLIKAYNRDVDADGKKEIILYLNSGTSGNKGALYILKQDKDGVYFLSETFEKDKDSIGSDNVFFIFNDKNVYIVIICLDSALQFSTGIRIYSFKDGKSGEIVTVNKKLSGFDMKSFYYEGSERGRELSQKDVEAIIKSGMDAGAALYKDGGNALHKTSEKDKPFLSVDINNDGKDEYLLADMLNRADIAESWYADVNKKNSISVNFGDTRKGVSESWLLHQIWFEKIGEDVYINRIINQKGTANFILNVFLSENSFMKPVGTYFLRYGEKYEITADKIS